MDKPIYGQLYSLTGGKGQPCIANGNTWEESRVLDRMAKAFVKGLNKQVAEKHQPPKCEGCGEL